VPATIIDEHAGGLVRRPHAGRQEIVGSPSRRLLGLALVLLLASAVVFALSGCDDKPDLPTVDPGPGSSETTPDAEAPQGMDVDEFVPESDWVAVGTYGGTSSAAKRLNILEPQTEYRLVCTVDYAPGDAQASASFWIEYGGQPLTEPTVVQEGSSGPLEIATGNELPANGLRLVAETSGFVTWEVEVYERK
jgi:hypothetical protein